MAAPSGFGFELRKNGDVVISQHGKHAATLRGSKASKFVADMASGDGQEAMARATGNYKRGNERKARSHQRNRDS